MQHVKPTSKGDPLCPLGFHPQVRWPTRCKRCFRDYKEHGNRNKEQDSQLRKDELTVSTPVLSSLSSSRNRNLVSTESNIGTRNWTSSSNLSTLSSSSKPNEDSNSISASSSWTSSPNLADQKEVYKEKELVTVSFTLPRRKRETKEDKDEEDDARRTQFTIRRRTTPSTANTNNFESVTIPSRNLSTGTSRSRTQTKDEPKPKPEIDFMMQVKESARASSNKDTKDVSKHGSSKSNRHSFHKDDSDNESIACTESTETTIVNEHELQDEIESLKKELEAMKIRCERSEREKSDFMLRRLASSDTVTSRTSASEVLKLQQKVNELKNNNEDLRDEKKSLSQRVRELENDLEAIRASGVQKEVQILREKLHASEKLCDELTEMNEEMKNEIRDMEEEMDEMHDKFREDRADEYTSLKKELEQQTKNCRILSFKLRKAERKTEQLEAEKLEAERKCREVAGGQSGLDKVERIKQLEHDLSVANEAAARLQKELDDVHSKPKLVDKEKSTTVKKKAPKLASLPKTPSGEKVSRESLTRGDSQEDPIQLLRDLQDSLEREADLREQLRFAEEEIVRLQVKKKLAILIPDNIPEKSLGSKTYLKIEREVQICPECKDASVMVIESGKMTETRETQTDTKESDKVDPCTEENELLLKREEMLPFIRKNCLVKNKCNFQRSNSLPDFCKIFLTNNSTQTEHKEFPFGLIPCLLRFGVFLPYSLAFSPLAALLLPLARRLSPSQQHLNPEPVEKDEGISDEDDPSELRILLELNEQEAAVLRRKVEELEVESDHLKKKVKDLQEKLNTKLPTSKRDTLKSTEPEKRNGVSEQKIKVLEEEMNELRKKLIEKERECERLHAEISLGVKKPKTIQKSKSLDGDQQTVDLKRQLQVIEAEANILRTKTQNLESENEKLVSENKKLSLMSSRRSSSVERLDSKSTLGSLEKQLEESNKKIKELEAAANKGGSSTIPIGEIEKLKNHLKKAEAEKKKTEEVLKRLKDEALEDVLNYYQKRVPKKPTDLSTKLQLKKMVEENENEISEMLVVLKKTGGLKKEKEAEQLKDELDKTKAKLDKMIKEAKEESSKKDIEISQLNKMIKDLESDKLKVKRDSDKGKTSWEKEKETLMESKTQLEKSKKELTEEVDKLKSEMKRAKAAKDEVSTLKKKIDALTKELEDEKKQSADLKKQLEGALKNTNESSKLAGEMSDKSKKIEELEKKLKEVEDKQKKSEKLVASKKEKITKLDKENEELGIRIIDLEKAMNNLASEKKSLQTKYDELDAKLNVLTGELETKKAEVLQLEKGLQNKEDSKMSKTASSKASQEVASLKDELATSKNKIKDLTEKINKGENELKETQNEMKKKERQMKKEIDEWEKKASELEMDLQADRKMMERLKSTQEKEMKAKDIEIAQLRTNSLTSGNIKVQELQSEIDRLEIALESEKHEYEELTSKYEQLEEEHVIMKATLVKEKEKAQSKLVKTENELLDIEAELKDLRETYTVKHENWLKEKSKAEEKNSECDKLLLEKTKLEAISKEKQSEVEQLKKETSLLSQQIECMRKDNEDLRSQIEDYDKVSKVQRNMTADMASLEKELRECKTRLVMEEKAKKTELAKLKHRYDRRITVISDELLSVQGQMARFKRERDSYRHMLEAAQKNGTNNINNLEDGDDPKNHIASLEQQISCLEDELSESRVEASRLRTELVSERSAWDVKISELNSKLNELEEEKILSSGRTKITGLKTKMELAWHKEREEQHRLLQETSTLARDLRQTLFEVERERDRERLESKRRIDQLKKSNEEEQEEIRKKVTEMQCDLLELRDAHAKLRTTNEKLRREKDKLDRERDILRQSIAMKKRMDQEEERNIISVFQLVEELTHLAPDLFPSKPRPPVTMPTPPARRKGPKSREASPLLERKDYSRESSVGRDDAKSHEVQEILRRLTEAANELKKSQLDDRDSRMRRSFSSFRSSSIESDSGAEQKEVKKRAVSKRGNSGLRKSISLEQSLAQEQLYEETEGSMTSVQSLEEMEKFRHSLLRRDQSLDSRLSGGSTQSEVLPSLEKKKKLGIFGKLKKLTKSKSIDQDGSELGSSSQLDPGSDISLSEDKGTMKDKFAGMFKKSGSSSRGNSVERSVKQKSSAERPLTSATLSGGDLSSSRPLTRKPPSSAPMQRKAKK
ncbi:centrosome-associated protein CEP250 isoform X2 [Cimex lectularius]|uniref:Uncharacterized protein n=1 Tax=Cimex lectularius TaxID=79782 RepID=A0A8I6RN13_CIMLE|nr:centrosome-associated protein CEP250 isoform X2 [Cimex lectularius]